MSTEGPWSTEEIASLYAHNDNLFHTRVNFLLAVQALLFTAGAQQWPLADLRLCLSLFGLLFTFLFWLSNVNLSRKLKWLMKEYEGKSPFFKKYRSVRRFPGLDTRFLFTSVIPLACALGWIAILVSALWSLLCKTPPPIP